MNNDPKAILEAYYAALNAHDAKAAIALFAEDAVREDITQPRDSRKIKGKAQIANGIRGRVADNILIEARNFQVAEDKVTCTVQVSTNYWRQRGLAPIEETAEVVVQQGKIVSFTTTLTPETVAKIQGIE